MRFPCSIMSVETFMPIRIYTLERCPVRSILKVTLIIFILTLSSSIASAKEKTYICASDFDYHPFSFINENGKMDGFDYASMRWIAKEMGFTIKYKKMPWAGTIPALLNKEVDMISSGMSITPERQKYVTFSAPYWQTRKIYLTKNDSTLDVDTIQNTKIRLGVKRGTTNAETAQKNIHDKGYAYTLRSYNSASLAIKDLLLGRIDAIATDSEPAEAAIAQGLPVKIIGDQGTADVFGVGMHHEDKELHALINEGYKRLMADPY